MKELDYYEEGQINAVVGGIVLLIVGVGVATLILIFVGSLGGQTYDLIESDLDTIGNYDGGISFVGRNDTAVYLGHTDIHNTTLNISKGTLEVNLNNFTIDYDLGTVLSKYPSYANGTAFNSTFKWGSIDVQYSVKRSIISGFEGLEQTGKFMPVVVLAVIIALVLSMVLTFGMGGMYGGGSFRGSAL